MVRFSVIQCGVCLVMQVYDFAMKEAAHLLLPSSTDEKEPQRKKKKKYR